MPTYNPEIKFVSFGAETESAGYYWRTAFGEVEAHMVHYGESSFAVVFTDPKPPAIKNERANFLLSNIRKLFNKQEDPNEAYELSEAAKARFADVVAGVGQTASRNMEGEIFYLREMPEETARQFADHAQDYLEQTAVRAESLHDR